ncbi:MAG: hypothetical protein ACE5F1_11785, partial [Planctomycetota bacterium]
TSPFVWLDFLGTPTSSQFGPFGGPATFSTYSDWCEAEDQDALFKFDTMPGTYSSGPPWNVVRYSIEYKDRQPFNPSKVGANIQSFMLITKLPQ